MKEQIHKETIKPLERRLIKKYDKLIAAEVERRIAERLPSLNEIPQIVRNLIREVDKHDCIGNHDLIIEVVELFYSRLTENNSAELSQIKQINATELPNKQEEGKG